MKKSIILASGLAAASASFAQISLNTSVTGIDGDNAGILNITQDLDLGTFSGNEFILESTTVVNPGVTLTIPAGTIMRGQPRSADDTVAPGTLLVSRGGAINAVGTATSPIIFTTAANDTRGRYTSGDTFLDADPVNNPLPPLSGSEANVGLWGAVTLLGYAPTNRGTSDTGVAGEAFIEGFGLTTEQVTYGGSLPNDSSGQIK
ncbi:MAG: hypothetical protein ACJ0BK_06330, partial [Coraliomargaritaceae bacterium]